VMNTPGMISCCSDFLLQMPDSVSLAGALPCEYRPGVATWNVGLRRLLYALVNRRT